ncbi:hypothetical protein IX329_002604 [Fusobacterium necrophorum]|nr:EpsG family protein [Fusobacterium necrophorum]MBR8734987.1 hypothetical protein [Fusobacterium necrophorum]MBR8791162.1 hypothetical protein [Fusobacterium necrophorum]
MVAYLILFGGCIFLSYFLKKKYIYVFITFLLIIFSAIRSPNIGTDSAEYLEILNNPNLGKFMEKGYYGISKISHFLNFNSTYFFGLISIIIIVPVMYYIFKIPAKFRWIALWLYLFNPYLYIQSNFNILRQGLSMSFSLLLLNSLLKKKYFLSSLFLLIGLGFHESILIAVCIFFINLIFKWNKIKLIFFLVTMYLLKILGVFKIVISILPKYFDLYYLHYLNHRENMFANNIVVTLHFIWFIVLVLQYKKMYKNKKEKKIANFFFITNALYFFFCLNSVFLRIYIYIYLWNIYIVTLIIKNTKSKIILYSHLIYTILLFILFYYLNSSNIHYFPYRTLIN